MKNIYANVGPGQVPKELYEMEVEMIANLSLRKSKTLDFLKSLESFSGKKGNLKAIRRKISKSIPYEEKLSQTIIELRGERI